MPLFNMRKRNAKGNVVETNPHTLLSAPPGSGYKPASSLPQGPSGPKTTRMSPLEAIAKDLSNRLAANRETKRVGEQNAERQASKSKEADRQKRWDTPVYKTGARRTGRPPASFK